MTRPRLVRLLFVLGALVLGWAVFVTWTGGIVFRVGDIRVSSRGPRNPVLLGLLSLALAWIAAPQGRRADALAAEGRHLSSRATRGLDRVPAPLRRPATIAAIASIGVVLVGFVEGAFVAFGSDAYGYVSQAHLWSIGEPRQSPPLARELGTSVPLEWQAPLGYRPSIDGLTIAPTYSSGLPLVMAVFERLVGPQGVFWVVPLLGGMLVWATYGIGARTYGPIGGATAAVLVATSPPVLVQLTDAPMSDLPAAAWWAVALALVCLDRCAGALGAGFAAGLAVLTRPNLAPLLMLVGGLMFARLGSTGRSRRAVIGHAFLFGIPAVAACLAVAAMNAAFWGSPFVSGYGSLTAAQAFSPTNIWPNLVLYPRVIATEMPVVVALPLAAWLRRRSGVSAERGSRLMTVALWTFVVMTAALYLSYPAFDSAWNLRFLLPAIPPLLVLAGAAALSASRRLLDMHPGAGVLALAIVGGYGVDYARYSGAFDTGHLRIAATAGAYVESNLPERAVVLALLHSGTANFYARKPTFRWDLVPPSSLDGLVDTLAAHGYVPYLMMDANERALFQLRLRGHSRLAAVDWAPLVTLDSDLRIYAIPPATSPRPR